MTLLAGLIVGQTASVSDFFPLVPGTRRTYEERNEDGSVTLADEVGSKMESFGDAPATPIVHRSQFNQVIGTDYYQVVGSTVFLVGRGEDRSETPSRSDGSIDFSKPRRKKTVIMTLTPRVPVLRYEGKETSWAYGDVPYLKVEGEDPIKTDETAIHGTAKPGPMRAVLGRRVETIEVQDEVQLGAGKIGQRIVETFVYGRGIGLIEATRRMSGAGQKTKETHTKLVSIEEAKNGG